LPVDAVEDGVGFRLNRRRTRQSFEKSDLSEVVAVCEPVHGCFPQALLSEGQHPYSAGDEHKEVCCGFSLE